MDELRIGCNQPLLPLIEERDGEPAGFEPELARLLCKRLGWCPRWLYRSFPDLPDALDAGEFDCIMWNFVATPQRAERFALSRAYGGTDMALLVRDASPLMGISDLAGRTVGAVLGTTNLEQARRLPQRPEVRVYDPGMKVLGQLVEDVLSGVIDAALDDAVPFRAIVARTLGVRIAATLPTRSRYAIAFRAADAARRDALDTALTALITSGDLARLWQSHVGEAIPNDVLNEPARKSA